MDKENERDVKMEKVDAFIALLEIELTVTAPELVAVIKCPDGEMRNRPLVDFATVYQIIDKVRKSMNTE